MPQAGGPAAINGFLYQIIQHLGWMSEVTLSGTLQGEAITEALLVLEPRTGGDARAEAEGVSIVEQYKARPDGTWSRLEIESVLVNLRKAIPASRPNHARYRFVTDGRPGRIDEFEKFLARVKASSNPNDLDKTAQGASVSQPSTSDYDYFEHLVRASRGTATADSDPDERAIVFHLLSHFEMEFASDTSARVQRLEQLLRPLAENLGDERRIRTHLVGELVDLLSKGEARLNADAIDEIFRKVRLTPDRLRKLIHLGDRLAALTRRRLARFKYQPSMDVRPAPAWPAGKSVLVITGASGAGKSWQLARLLEELLATRQAASLVPAASTAEDVTARAAQDVWQLGLGETYAPTLLAVSHFLRELAPKSNASCSPPPLLVVGFDDVQDIDLARNLVRQDWPDMNMRLVLTAPSAVARALEYSDAESIHVHTLQDFATSELDELLNRHGRQWSELPADLKRLLRNPILARLFLELSYSSFRRSPRSEYEIFEGFWKRIATRARFSDEGIVLALARHVLNEKPYPVPRSQWREIGLDTEEAALRLETAGWLQTLDGGEITFAHDRLLNWAVAKSLVQDHQHKRLSTDDLSTLLAGEPPIQRHLHGKLGYVPMDALWLLAEHSTNAALLAQIVSRFEAGRDFGFQGEELYRHHLPTLGPRAVPILTERLATTPDNGAGDYQAKLIGQSLAALARQDGIDLEEFIDSLLLGPNRQQHIAAIAVATVRPKAQYLDRLYRLHVQNLDALDDRTRDARFSDYDATFDALRVALTLNPGWLHDRILNADPQHDRISELGFLLNGLEHSDAPVIWKDVRERLIEQSSPAKRRSVLYCIARFKDLEKQDFVLRHLTDSHEPTAGAAFAALAVLDPRAAVERLTDFDGDTRAFYRSHWLPILLLAEPELTRRRILQLAQSDPRGIRVIEDLFSERPDEMDEALLRFFLTTLEHDLNERIESTTAGDAGRVYFCLRVLKKIVRPELLSIIQSRAGTRLEELITTVACNRLRTNSRTTDNVVESARRVLILMAGSGITTLLKRELDSEHHWVRHSGLLFAYMRDDGELAERLATIARRAPGNAAPRDSEAAFERHQALEALAALGPDSTLLESIQIGDPSLTPIDLAALRDHRGPMAKALTDRASLTLRDTEASENALHKAVVVAWLSDDVDLIPHLQSVLERASPDSALAHATCIALQALGDKSEAFAGLAERLLRTPSSTFWGLNAMISIGDPALERVHQWLREATRAIRQEDIDRAIRALYRHPATRGAAIDAAVTRSLRRVSGYERQYDIASEANDPALREQILDKAFGSRTVIVGDTLRAIEGLAKFDPSRAAEAIAMGLQSIEGVERSLAQLLVRVAPDNALSILINAALQAKREMVTRAVGHALRRLDQATVSESLLLLMGGGSLHERHVAVDLAAWVPAQDVTNELARRADQDGSSEVRYAAFSALAAHQRLAHVQGLLAAFPSSPVERQWSLLVAILDAVDPFLLDDAADPLCVHRVLARVPEAFAHHTEHVLHNRKRLEKQRNRRTGPAT